MGNYNAQYENYYSRMIRKRKSTPGYSKPFSRNEKSGNFYVRRLIQELTGGLLLFTFVIVCKVIVTPQTQMVYQYSKKVLNTSYNYNVLFQRMKEVDMVQIEEVCTTWLEKAKCKITGGETIEQKIKNHFITPVDGDIISHTKEAVHLLGKKKRQYDGVEIGTKAEQEIKACYDGRVKKCGEEAELGKYIIIDHGSGIETKYGHLKEILVEEEDIVKKEQIIGKNASQDGADSGYLYFELLYMGQNKNPQEFLPF